jgi:hypothetical protein
MRNERLQSTITVKTLLSMFEQTVETIVTGDALT